MPFTYTELFLIAISIPALIWLAKKIRKGFEPAAEKPETPESDLSPEVLRKIEDGFYRTGDLVLLASFDYAAEAAILRGLLLDSGIFAVIRDEHIGLMKFKYAEAIGGIKLYVHEAELELARKIVADHNEIDAGAGTEWELRRCPKCGSATLSYQRFHPAGVLPLLLGVPFPPFFANRWVCLACSHKWRDVPEKKAG